MRLQTNGWTPQLVPRPDFDSPFRSEHVSGRVQAPSGTSGLDYALKLKRSPSSTSNQTHEVINTNLYPVQHRPHQSPGARLLLTFINGFELLNIPAISQLLRQDYVAKVSAEFCTLRFNKKLSTTRQIMSPLLANSQLFSPVWVGRLRPTSVL